MSSDELAALYEHTAAAAQRLTETIAEVPALENDATRAQKIAFRKLQEASWALLPSVDDFLNANGVLLSSPAKPTSRPSSPAYDSDGNPLGMPPPHQPPHHPSPSSRGSMQPENDHQPPAESQDIPGSGAGSAPGSPPHEDVDGPSAKEPRDPSKKKRAKENGGDDDEKKDPAAADSVSRRIAAVLEIGLQPPLDETEIFRLVMYGRTSSVPSEETKAMGRILRGFGITDLNVWRNLFATHAHDTRTHDDMREQLRQVDELVDLGDRLIKREQEIKRLLDEADTSSFGLFALRQIEGIKFAKDWKGLAGRGSRKYKQSYNESVFAQQHLELRSMTAKQRSEALGTGGAWDDQFTLWKRQNEVTVTSRNQILTLYNACGAVVLLDPVWDIRTRRTKGFAKMCDAIYESLGADDNDEDDHPHTTKAFHEKTSNILSSVLKHLKMLEIRADVASFLKEHPPTFMVSH
ncbi:hypothetical protein EIP91_001667 [Steccherinum ochraceum]|uniref:Uncharacterized protein n=1 Tax=Steccherinum ochraceum TaxID=92696 RepID=A0A4R0RU69_9APHY|nr:hypothetical protein EIP91_001667 [Steccherinum ochraceum]